MLTMVALFEHPTIRALARCLAGEPTADPDARRPEARTAARARLSGRRGRLGAGRTGDGETE